MVANMDPKSVLQFKKAGYWLFLLPVLIVYLSWYLAVETGMPNLFAWFPVFVVFGIIPVLDYLVGQDPVNPDEQTEVPALSEEKYYRFLTLMVVPMQLLVTVGGGYAWVSQWDSLSLAGSIGWVVSIGVASGILAINVGHELVHKDSKLETWAGGFLLSLVTYAGFKVEHVRGHHVHVSTPEDASSSRYGQSLYAFLPHAFIHNFLNAWSREAKELRRRGYSPFSWRNELIWWYSISGLFLLGFTLAFGWKGALYFLATSFFAASTLEVINYIEHYGLHRRKLENGKYERTTIHHSWNSNFLLTNLVLFHLQRHSDHHAYAKRRYQVLRHHDESPQLPLGYAGMFVIALIPPLWFRVMNPRVEAYYAGESHQLTANQTVTG
ncbi:MAG TPA: alkane 1-monooxygenase [Thiobacillaceae bacterium]